MGSCESVKIYTTNLDILKIVIRIENVNSFNQSIPLSNYSNNPYKLFMKYEDNVMQCELSNNLLIRKSTLNSLMYISHITLCTFNQSPNFLKNKYITKDPQLKKSLMFGKECVYENFKIKSILLNNDIMYDTIDSVIHILALVSTEEKHIISMMQYTLFI